MKYIDEFRQDKDIRNLSAAIHNIAGKKPMRFMEVCGTHTMSIARFAIPELLPDNIRLISGPGCPVCVTPTGFIDAAIELSKRDVIIATFGDMIRVPGGEKSLQDVRGEGFDVRIVYSPLDAIEIAKNSTKEVVFLGVGFETTTPTISATIQVAKKLNLKNYSVLCAHKLVPPALKALVDGKLELNGFILPGHVSVIIGKNAYQDLFNSCKIPMAIAGFEPTDIMLAILDLVEQVVNNKPSLDSSYSRVVHNEGNKKAIDSMYDVFEVCDSSWRGIGTIPMSGLKIKSSYEYFDAAKKFSVEIKDIPNPKGCLCGEVLKGIKLPLDCKLFGKTCTPIKPVGPCMVSSEGTCAAFYKYGRKK